MNSKVIMKQTTLGSSIQTKVNSKCVLWGLQIVCVCGGGGINVQCEAGGTKFTM